MKLLIENTEKCRAEFNSYMKAYLKDMDKSVHNEIYPSSHFFERVVERHFEKHILDIFFAAMKGYKFMKETSYRSRKLKCIVGNMQVCMDIKTGAVSNKRQLVLTIVYDVEDENVYAEDLLH